jgi:hypothetical protein
MNISIDLNYFINQIQLQEDKELLKYYYEHITKHIEYSKCYIELKKELLKYISNYHNNTNNNQNKLIQLINESINIIENDAMTYKNEFKILLYTLIQKSNKKHN